MDAGVEGAECDELVEGLGVVGDGHVLAKGTEMTSMLLWMADSKTARTATTAHSVDLQTL